MKKEWKYFTIAEVDKEQEYLREMHRHGWALAKVVFPGLYYFEECEPKDVIYQLDYNTDAEKNKEEYTQLFRDCGWEYVLTFVGYHYFKKGVEDMKAGDEEIFNDDDSKLEMQKRVFQGRIVPLLILFIGVVLPQLFLQFHNMRDDGNVKPFIFYIIIAIIYIIVFVLQYNTYRKLKSLRR